MTTSAHYIIDKKNNLIVIMNSMFYKTNYQSSKEIVYLIQNAIDHLIFWRSELFLFLFHLLCF